MLNIEFRYLTINVFISIEGHGTQLQITLSSVHLFILPTHKKEGIHKKRNTKRQRETHKYSEKKGA